MSDSSPIHCVCCPAGRREVLAVQEGTRLIIQGQRHGRRHTAVVEGVPAQSERAPTPLLTTTPPSRRIAAEGAS